MEKNLFKYNFIQKSSEVHNNKYDYSLVDYKHSRQEVIIICPIHGQFKQKPVSHAEGHGCKKCASMLSGEKTKLSLDEFLTKAKSVHGDRYDYSLSQYYNAKTPINIICKVHGVFEQKPNSHLMGKGCRECGAIASNEAKKTHGFSKHPLYYTWLGMVRRCNDPETSNYKDYGGRGIEVSKEFLFSFDVFSQYVSSLPNYENRKEFGLSLDRIDNDGNYEKGNLRWANQKEQNGNRRKLYNSKYKGVKVFGDAFKATITIELGEFPTLEAALSARNEYIEKHNLPHKIQK